MERYLGIEEARAKLGSLADEVAEGGEAVVLSKRGRARAVLVDRDEYLRFKLSTAKEAREELARVLEETRRRIDEAGLDSSLVDEAVDAARRLD